MAPKPLDIDIRTRGVDGVRRDIAFLKGDLDAFGKEGKNATRAGQGLAAAFLEIAHSGDFSGRSIKELVREGGELATLIGANGLIIGGAVLLGVALYEAFSKGEEAVKELRRQLEDLNAAHVRVAAEMSGNRLGVAEQDLADRYNKAFREIEKQAPGIGNRIGVLIAAGLNLGPDFFSGISKIAYTEAVKTRLAKNTYDPNDPNSEINKAKREEALNRGLADAGALSVGLDPVQRYREQLRTIELEREKSIETGELSQEAADKRAIAQRELLDRAAYDLNQSLGTEVAVALAKLNRNAFDAQLAAEEGRYQKEKEGVDKLTLSEEQRVAVLDQIELKHRAITLEIEKQRKYTIETAHADAQRGSINPLEQLKGDLAAIEIKKKKALDAGVAEVDAAKTAENEKRQLFEASVDAAVRSNESLAKIATKVALDPLISYLEGLAIQEGIKAAADAASFNFAGAAAHAAVATAAILGAHEIAQLAGSSAGGGGSVGGSSGGLSASSVSAAGTTSQGKASVVFPNSPTFRALMADPQFRADFLAALQQLAGDRDLDFIFTG